MEGLIIGLVVWVVAIVVAIAIGIKKGRGGTGFVLGFFLSWLGVIIIALIKPKTEKLIERGELKKCPHCAEAVLIEAKTCKYCGKDID